MSAGASVLITVTALSSATVGGVFFAFDAFVLRALAALPDGQGAVAMRSVNVFAVRPALMTAVFGTAALAVGAGIVGVLATDPLQTALLTGGAAAYLVGVMGTTIGRNVPLNNALAAGSAETVWQRYLIGWARANRVRTCSAVGAAAALLAGLAAGA